MKLTKITANLDLYPEDIRKLIEASPIFDSSSSPEAMVLFIDKDEGYFLKSAEKGALTNEAELGQYFYKKDLAPEILLYSSLEKDFLLTRKARGADATDKRYLEEPKRLAAKMGEVLRYLHELDFDNCPVKDRMKSYFELAETNAGKDKYDLSFGDFQTKEEALAAMREGKKILKCDTLIHGDFCLPNIIFDDWNFSSFIDLGGGGVGDRHVDIFWGAWTLNFNLKTDAYRDIFFDAYGKEHINPEALASVSAAEIFG
ncbi:MAG: aminoglycoside 3'-phosphotransferase [Clostridia bacterium]|nr:aminoglycoside 3'-phosphotransferase [Clostridia bacterium]